MKPAPTKADQTNAINMPDAPTRSFIHIALVFLLIGLPSLAGHAGAEELTPTPTSTSSPAPFRYFKARLQLKNVDAVGPSQDVQGKVANKAGAGIDGVVVRAFSGDWQAFETTKDGGKFKFTLTRGSFTMQLVDAISEEAKLTLDGKTEPQVEFYEVESLPPSPTSVVRSPTVTATSAVTPTVTATATATPSATSTVPPTFTSVPPGKDEPEVESTPATAVSALPLPSEIDFKPWLSSFLGGIVLGGVLLVFGIVIVLMRRL